MHLVLLVRLPNTELSNFDFPIFRIIHDASSIWPAPVFSPGAPMMKSVRPGICRNNVYDVRIHDRKFFKLFICLHSNFWLLTPKTTISSPILISHHQSGPRYPGGGGGGGTLAVYSTAPKLVLYFNYRIHNNISKFPLKSIFSEYLPKEIIDRKKVGFPVPLANIFPDKNDPMDQWLQFNLDTLNISKKRLR